MRIEDKDRLAKIYDQHKIVKNAERFIDAALIADTIRNARHRRSSRQPGFRFFLPDGALESRH
jgi:hypothetical protein